MANESVPEAADKAYSHRSDLESCLSRASALAIALSDQDVVDSLAQFTDAQNIMGNLHWLLSEEIIRAQGAFGDFLKAHEQRAVQP